MRSSQQNYAYWLDLWVLGDLTPIKKRINLQILDEQAIAEAETQKKAKNA